MLVEIVIERGTERRVEQREALGPLAIGRDARCEVCLPDQHVSRQHVIVQAENDRLRVEDVSSNGTLAGDTLIRRSALDVPYGTPLSLGAHRITVRPLDGAPPRTLLNPAAPTVVPPREPVAAQPAVSTDDTGRENAGAELRREIHRRLLRELDLASLAEQKIDDVAFRPKVLTALRRIVRSLRDRLDGETNEDALIGELADEALGLGPLESLLEEPAVSEIMVVDAHTVYVERAGKMELTNKRFTDDDRVRAVIERIVTPLGRRIDESSPLVDARLKNGSRVNAVIQPLALRGSCITIRKFSSAPLTLQRLYELGALTPSMGQFLSRCVLAKKNIVISGGTGSGKTTLLNLLSSAIPSDERIVTIEDAAELRLAQPHVIALETRPANAEGKGHYTIRDLLRNALRMRPDRIVVGECRGGEALDMLQAMNTGHDGSLTTTHANSPEEALKRLETLSLMGGIDLPSRAIREQIAASLHVVVQQSRLSDGSRKLVAITEVAGLDERGNFRLRPIYRFTRSGTASGGKVRGEFSATGYLPSFLGDFILRGLIQPGEDFL